MSDEEVRLPLRWRLYAAALTPRERTAFAEAKLGVYTSKPFKAYARGVTSAGVMAWKIMLAIVLTAVVLGCFWLISAIASAPQPG